MKKSNRKEELENAYQEIASLISKTYFWEIEENEYPKLVVKNGDNKKYEVIVKEIKN
jgi:hypothetical protein